MGRSRRRGTLGPGTPGVFSRPGGLRGGVGRGILKSRVGEGSNAGGPGQTNPPNLHHPTAETPAEAIFDSPGGREEPSGRLGFISPIPPNPNWERSTQELQRDGFWGIFRRWRRRNGPSMARAIGGVKQWDPYGRPTETPSELGCPKGT